MTPLLAGALAALSLSIGLLAIPLLLDRGPVERLGLRVGHEEHERGAGPVTRLLEALATRLGPRLAASLRASRREAIARRLDLAGRRSPGRVTRFVGQKAATLIVAAVAMLLLVSLGWPPAVGIAVTVAAWWFPDILLSRDGRLRQERVERELPDFLDILAVTVRAGLGYRAALRRVAESLGGPVGEEMLIALRQMDLGASRRDAFLALRDRNASESLSSFVTAQLQAEELGVPFSEALNDIALDMRRLAYQNARRRAQRAAPRVSLIVTTVIVPGAMILIVLAMLLGSGIRESGLFG